MMSHGQNDAGSVVKIILNHLCHVLDNLQNSGKISVMKKKKIPKPVLFKLRQTMGYSFK